MVKLKAASAERMSTMLNELDRCNKTPGEGTTRVLFTDEEIQARNLVKRWMAELRLHVYEDAIGNIFGRLQGVDPSLPPVWMGSHIDTVLHGGKFDGMVGVVGAIESIRLIKEVGIQPLRSIEVVVFTSEEPTRFGMGCLGSRALAGCLSLEEAKELKDSQGQNLAEVLAKLGYDLGDFSNIAKANNAVHVFLELHIEQGAVLEHLNVPIGLVTTICAPTDIHVSVIGKQGHAGATPMNMRYDAFMATADIGLRLESLVKDSESPHSVGTIGKVRLYPNASNVIPGQVDFTVDIRDSQFPVKDAVLNSLMTFMKEVEDRRQVEIRTQVVNHDYPQNCDERVIGLIRKSCEQMNIPFHEMVSGAYHDAMFVAKFAPIGMIFVPSKDGVSHNPNEWTDYEDVAKGVDVLANTMLQLVES